MWKLPEITKGHNCHSTKYALVLLQDTGMLAAKLTHYLRGPKHNISNFEGKDLDDTT